jgi:hypothetical protein
MELFLCPELKTPGLSTRVDGVKTVRYFLNWRILDFDKFLSIDWLIELVIFSLATTIINLYIRFNIDFAITRFITDSEYSWTKTNPTLILGSDGSSSFLLQGKSPNWNFNASKNHESKTRSNLRP